MVFFLELLFSTWQSVAVAIPLGDPEVVISIKKLADERPLQESYLVEHLAIGFCLLGEGQGIGA